jgi:hypothetical protein
LSGDVAQLGERQLCKLDVVGSNPIVSSKKKYKKIKIIIDLVFLLSKLAGLLNFILTTVDRVFDKLIQIQG